MRHLLILGACLAGPACAQVEQGAPSAGFAPAFANQTRAPALEGPAVASVVVTEGLAHPWGIAELPDGTFLVTERPGRLRMMQADGRLSEPLAGVPEVDNRDQGGLLDVAVPEDFAQTRRVYLTYAKRLDGGTVTAAGWGMLSEDGGGLEEFTEIFVQDPPSQTPKHYGSRLLFEPGTDNVIITTGEHSSPYDRQFAQDNGTTYGKIIRIGRDDGVPPGDNPFVGEAGALDTIWSYGHRNVQGAAHDAEGTLWTIEHGPRGGDELNRPEAGLNYGWPVISYGINYNGNPIGSGEAVREGMEQPVYYWDPVIAPGGMEFYAGDVFPAYEGDVLIGGLVAAGIVRLSIGPDGRVDGEERILPGVGRVRDVEVTSTGEVLFLIDSPAPYGAVLRLTPDA